jgi:hypothetical protein
MHQVPSGLIQPGCRIQFLGSLLAVCSWNIRGYCRCIHLHQLPQRDVLRRGCSSVRGLRNGHVQSDDGQGPLFPVRTWYVAAGSLVLGLLDAA